MDSILASLPSYMFVGIIVVIGVSQLNRIVGSLLGIAFWIFVAVIGTEAYARGGAIGLPGFQFSRNVFYGVCVIFSALSAWNAYRAISRRGTWKPDRNNLEQ